MRRKDGPYGAFSQRPMPDFTPSRAAQRSHFANTVRREIVVEHEAFRGPAPQVVYGLLIALRPQGCDHKSLGFATGKQRRTVRTRQHGDTAADRPNIGKAAAISAPSFFENLPTHLRAFHVMQKGLDRLGTRCRIRLIRDLECLHHLLFKRGHRLLTLQFSRSCQSGFEPLMGHRLDILLQCLINGRRRHRQLGFAGPLLQLKLYINTGLQCLMGRLQSRQDDVFWKFQRPAFHHDDGLLASGHHHIQLSAFQFPVGWVDDDLVIRVPHAYCPDWS